MAPSQGRAANDTGVSSYTVRSVHAQGRALLTDPCIAWHINRWYASVFTHGSDLPWIPQALLSWKCAMNYRFILFEKAKAGVFPPAGGRLFIPLSKEMGLLAWIGKPYIQIYGCNSYICVRLTRKGLFQMKHARLWRKTGAFSIIPGGFTLHQGHESKVKKAEKSR
jgi:hypothetical protein